MKEFIRSLKNLIRTIGTLISAPPAFLPPHCCNINALLMHLCDHDPELHKWVLRWIAYPLRHPGAKMSTCLVFNGGEGSGKSTFFERVIAAVYGSAARRIDTSDLRKVFNGWTVGAHMVIINGEYARTMTQQLKHLVTEARIWINEKYQPERMDANQMNFVVLSGNPDFVPVAASDRRFVVVEVPPAQTPTFYRAVNDEIINGGVDAFRYYLLHDLDMGDFSQRTPPPLAYIPPAQRAAA